jgi:hypothetical protein
MPNDASGPAHLQRNKTERRRLQGLQRSTPGGDGKTTATKWQPTGFLPRFKHWMINEGGRVIFYGTWLFVHLLVGVLGTLHYGLKDNLVNSRAVFGATFGKAHDPIISVCPATDASAQSSLVRLLSFFTLMQRLFFCLCAATSSPSAVALRSGP